MSEDTEFELLKDFRVKLNILIVLMNEIFVIRLNYREDFYENKNILMNEIERSPKKE